MRLLVDDYTFWMTPEHIAFEKERARVEKQVHDKFMRRIRKAVEEAAPTMANWGDGNCGVMIQDFLNELIAVGAYGERTYSGAPKKAVIGRKLSKAVFERDAYRCVSCESHVDLCCDHIISEHDGGPTTLENLQTMCRSCNSSKGKKSFSVLRSKAA